MPQIATDMVSKFVLEICGTSSACAGARHSTHPTKVEGGSAPQTPRTTLCSTERVEGGKACVTDQIRL
nr:hypothetical protein CFP56_07700 [Quercus suber]